MRRTHPHGETTGTSQRPAQRLDAPILTFDLAEELEHLKKEELSSPERRDMLATVVDRSDQGPVTLVYGARDEEHNGAVVVKEVLEGMMERTRRHAA